MIFYCTEIQKTLLVVCERFDILLYRDSSHLTCSLQVVCSHSWARWLAEPDNAFPPPGFSESCILGCSVSCPHCCRSALGMATFKTKDRNAKDLTFLYLSYLSSDNTLQCWNNFVCLENTMINEIWNKILVAHNSKHLNSYLKTLSFSFKYADNSYVISPLSKFTYTYMIIITGH